MSVLPECEDETCAPFKGSHFHMCDHSAFKLPKMQPWVLDWSRQTNNIARRKRGRSSLLDVRPAGALECSHAQAPADCSLGSRLPLFESRRCASWLCLNGAKITPPSNVSSKKPPGYPPYPQTEPDGCELIPIGRNGSSLLASSQLASLRPSCIRGCATRGNPLDGPNSRRKAPSTNNICSTCRGGIRPMPGPSSR
jgi:hypothetical protein